jgi:hypothetical protein
LQTSKQERRRRLAKANMNCEKACESQLMESLKKGDAKLLMKGDAKLLGISGNIHWES